MPPPPAPTPLSETKEETLERVVASFQEHARFYSNIEAVPENREKLDDSYEKVMIMFNELVKMEREVKEDPPPPPPKPMDPEGRIKLHAEKAPEAPQSLNKISERNLLNINVNWEGLILMDEEPVRLSKVQSRVREFITNNGADLNLSDSPKRAVVSVKPTEKTPPEIFQGIVNEIKGTYLKVWNAAAQDEFGTDYKKLSGSEREKNEAMYPRQILIREPNKAKKL